MRAPEQAGDEDVARKDGRNHHAGDRHPVRIEDDPGGEQGDSAGRRAEQLQ
jgi:hypothetical protein